MFVVTYLWVVVVKNDCRNLDYDSEHGNNYWVGMLKNGRNLLDYETQKSVVLNGLNNPVDWLNNFCMLIVIE